MGWLGWKSLSRLVNRQLAQVLGVGGTLPLTLQSTAAPLPACPHQSTNPKQEMEFAAACLAYDAKNEHAWAHRQALLGAWGAAQPGLGLWGAELAFTERLLRDDVRNNSGE